MLGWIKKKKKDIRSTKPGVKKTIGWYERVRLYNQNKVRGDTWEAVNEWWGYELHHFKTIVWVLIM